MRQCMRQWQMAVLICLSAAETATTSRHEVKLVLSWRCITLISIGRIKALHHSRPQ